MSNITTAPPPSEDEWQQDPVLAALANLLQNMKQGRFEEARQEAQMISKCLALGASPDPQLLEWMLIDVTGW